MRPAFLFGVATITSCASASAVVKRQRFSQGSSRHGTQQGQGGRRDGGGNNFPLSDGFPNPTSDQIINIQERAHGTLPNTPLPSDLSDDGITSMKLIAFNELFEVAFFSDLVNNITNDVKGYQFGDNKSDILDNLKTILAVEELHALGANSILQANGEDPIKPCKYNFPVSDFGSAISLASTFTDVVLGTLQDANDHFAQDEENGMVRLLSSVIGNEGEQEGLFRVINKKTTPAQPFLTTGTRDFAFSAIQLFTAQGSCPSIEDIPLNTYKPLKILTEDIQPENQYLTMSFDSANVDVDVYSLSIVYINGQNKPVVRELESIDAKDAVITFQANFPFEDFSFYGLTLAAVTHQRESFENADDVAAQTLFGPGLIEVS